MSAFVGVSLIVTLVALVAIRMVGRGRTAGTGAGRGLRVASFILTVIPASYLVIEGLARQPAAEEATGWDWGFLISVAGVPVFLSGVAAALPRSGSAVVPLTWGAALVLLYWVGIFSIVGLGVLYWPAAFVLIAAAKVQTARRPPRNGQENQPPKPSVSEP